MTLALKLFCTLFGILLVGFLFVMLEPSKSMHHTKIQAITSITKLPGLSLSTPPFQERIPFYKDSSNRFYLNANSYNYMEFVYAQ